jgi:hypothetical protein
MLSVFKNLGAVLIPSERKSDKFGSSCLPPTPANPFLPNPPPNTPPSTPSLLSYFKQNVGFEFGNASHYPDMSIINHATIATSTVQVIGACLLAWTDDDGTYTKGI